MLAFALATITASCAAGTFMISPNASINASVDRIVGFTVPFPSSKTALHAHGGHGLRVLVSCGRLT